MNKDSIKAFIIPLSAADFNHIVDLIFNNALGVHFVVTDRKGDGGSDRRVLKLPGESTGVAYQVTVQKSDWQNKAYNDAVNAVTELKATQYYFLTSQSREPTALRRLELKISSNLHIPATCLGADEIASLIFDNKLELQMFEALGVSTSRHSKDEPAHLERLLHSYLAFSTDALRFKEGVFDDTLLVILNDDGSISRDDLVAKALAVLGADLYRSEHLDRRVDALLTRGLVAKNRETGLLTLSTPAAQQLDVANRTYDVEFAALVAAQQAALQQNFKIAWPLQAAQKASMLVARAFIKEKLELAKDTSANVVPIHLFRQMGDPLQDLRDLLAEYGVPTRYIPRLVAEFVDIARELPIIKKLTRVAFYIALEGSNSVSSIKALGANSWSEVVAYVDASAAIPYICARLFAPTFGRNARSYTQTFKRLSQLGVTLKTPFFYIQEIAAHLIRATAFTHLTEFKDDLVYSENGFVSHYFQLISVGSPHPDTLFEYLIHYSESLRNPASDRALWLRKVMTDLQPLLNEYGIAFEYIGKVPTALLEDITRHYDFALAPRTKAPVLRRHDILMLGYMRQMVSERHAHAMLLTWDRVTVETGRSSNQCGLVVSPNEASELISDSLPLSDSQLSALSHRLARTMVRPEQVAAQIIDQVAEKATAQLADWEFRKKIREFRDSMVGRIDLTRSDYEEWVRQETRTFLESEGVKSPDTEIVDDIEADFGDSES